VKPVLDVADGRAFADIVTDGTRVVEDDAKKAALDCFEGVAVIGGFVEIANPVSSE
jgi:hypothetical protein